GEGEGGGELGRGGGGHRVGLREAADPAADLAVLVERGEVEAFGVVHASLGVADGDHMQASLGQQARRGSTNLPITLHRYGWRLLVDVKVFEGFESQVGRAATRSLDPTF